MVTTTTGLATSFIQFSRTSNATVTGVDGRICWAGHNLLTNSESFDASAWVKSSATVTANSIAAPDGATTADTIAASGANGTALQAYTAAGFQLTFAVWLRRKTGTGTIEIAADSGTYTAVTITSSWALYTVTQTPASGSRNAGIRIVTSGDEVYAWGAHLYRSDLGGMVLNPARGDAYYPTTPRNLLGFTEDFSNAAWTKSGNLAFGSGSVSNAIIAPNGLQTADLFVESTGAVAPQVFQSVSAIGSGTPVTLSVYAKYAGRVLQLAFGSSDVTSNPRANFDLQSGLTGSVDAGIAASITPVGNGWYRCSATATTAVSSAFDCLINLVNSTTSARSAVYTGDGTSGIYLWGAQLSDSASLDAYSPVYGAAVTSTAYYAPRLDFDPVTLAAKGLLVEEQRTNFLLHSAAFDNVSWDKVAVGTASAPVVTANNATAPDGTLTADLVVFDRGAGTSGDRSVLSQAPSLSAGTYTQSVWLKAATAGDIGKQLALRNVAGGTYLVVTLTASWVRYERTEVWAVNNWEIANRQGITADTTVSAHVWGAQLEAGSFATSYIPTLAASATRSADVASVSTQAFPYSATEGTIVAAFDVIGNKVSVNQRIVSLDEASNGTFLVKANTTLSWTVFSGGSLQATLSATNTTLNAAIKSACAFKTSDFASSTNGATPVTASSGSFGGGSQLSIGTRLAGDNQLNGHIRQITYLPRRISNSELQARTV